MNSLGCDGKFVSFHLFGALLPSQLLLLFVKVVANLDDRFARRAAWIVGCYVLLAQGLRAAAHQHENA